MSSTISARFYEIRLARRNGWRYKMRRYCNGREATGLYRFYLPLIADFWGRIFVRFMPTDADMFDFERDFLFGCPPNARRTVIEASQPCR